MWGFEMLFGADSVYAFIGCLRLEVGIAIACSLIILVNNE
jgi:hypothetical protein